VVTAPTARVEGEVVIPAGCVEVEKDRRPTATGTLPATGTDRGLLVTSVTVGGVLLGLDAWLRRLGRPSPG